MEDRHRNRDRQGCLGGGLLRFDRRDEGAVDAEKNGVVEGVVVVVVVVVVEIDLSR